jgi:hypothetical protein
MGQSYHAVTFVQVGRSVVRRRDVKLYRVLTPACRSSLHPQAIQRVFPASDGLGGDSTSGSSTGSVGHYRVQGLVI